jgi:hypothetical protein
MVTAGCQIERPARSRSLSRARSLSISLYTKKGSCVREGSSNVVTILCVSTVVTILTSLTVSTVVTILTRPWFSSEPQSSICVPPPTIRKSFVPYTNIYTYKHGRARAHTHTHTHTHTPTKEQCLQQRLRWSVVFFLLHTAVK